VQPHLWQFADLHPRNFPGETADQPDIDAGRGPVITRDQLPWVVGDPVQLIRLFQNLLVNSIKYRSQVAPRIHIAATRDGSDWLFSVKDDGVGIEPQYAEKVFGIFKCLQRDRSSGSGMGLAICRKIVSRHEGRIWVESQLGQGATFLFTLPMQLDDASGAETAAR
jgi:light-regulated signal transduction histidine kinase (bacteriophytochrome)